MKAFQVFQNGKDDPTCEDTLQLWRVGEVKLDLGFCITERLVSNLEDNSSNKLNFKCIFYKSHTFQLLLLLSKVSTHTQRHRRNKRRPLSLLFKTQLSGHMITMHWYIMILHFKGKHFPKSQISWRSSFFSSKYFWNHSICSTFCLTLRYGFFESPQMTSSMKWRIGPSLGKPSRCFSKKICSWNSASSSIPNRKTKQKTQSCYHNIIASLTK